MGIVGGAGRSSWVQIRDSITTSWIVGRQGASCAGYSLSEIAFSPPSIGESDHTSPPAGIELVD